MIETNSLSRKFIAQFEDYTNNIGSSKGNGTHWIKAHGDSLTLEQKSTIKLIFYKFLNFIGWRDQSYDGDKVAMKAIQICCKHIEANKQPLTPEESHAVNKFLDALAVKVKVTFHEHIALVKVAVERGLTVDKAKVLQEISNAITTMDPDTYSHRCRGKGDEGWSGRTKKNYFQVPTKSLGSWSLGFEYAKQSYFIQFKNSAKAMPIVRSLGYRFRNEDFNPAPKMHLSKEEAFSLLYATPPQSKEEFPYAHDREKIEKFELFGIRNNEELRHLKLELESASPRITATQLSYPGATSLCEISTDKVGRWLLVDATKIVKRVLFKSEEHCLCLHKIINNKVSEYNIRLNDPDGINFLKRIPNLETHPYLEWFRTAVLSKK